jgi:hypothetical protein
MTSAVSIAQGGTNNVTMRNRIINGAMVIDQRNAGASVTVNNATAFFSVDRFYGQAQPTDGVFTLQQVADAPAGFTKSLKATVTTADASIGATQYYNFSQSIEGFNMADFAWGTANASTVTLSFWVKSSVTGVFGGAITNASNNRSYPYTYTINSANTWEQKAVTLSGDQSGTWATDNTIGAKLFWSLGTGATYKGTAGSWAGTLYIGATGEVSPISTSGATFYITGVQLEAGTTATPFENRLYGTELVLCQRYYYQVNSTATQYATLGSAYARTTTIATAGGISLPVTMRAIPTLTATNTAGAFGVSIGGSDFAGPTVSLAGQVSASAIAFTLTLGSGTMTVGQGGQMYITNNAAYFVGLSAEL